MDLKAGPGQKLVSAMGAGCASLAVACVMHFEGRRQTVYLDPVRIPTVCDGITGADVHVGDAPRTNDQCDAMLVQRLVAEDAALKACVHVPMSDGEHAAWLSFVHNVGAGRFCSSTAHKLLNAGQHRAACEQLPRFVYAGPNVLPGLVTRRAAERAMCEEGMPA